MGDASVRGTFDQTSAKCWIRNNSMKAANADNFSQMVWRDSERIAFGVRAPWVVAWYCDGGNTPRPGKAGSAASYEKNVARTCIVGGMNTCYNKLALKAHNDKRKMHEDTRALNANDDAAKAIQKIMDVEGFDGTMPLARNRPENFRDCTQNTYVMADTSKIEQLSSGADGLDFATESWYDLGNAQIDYMTGKPLNPNNPSAQADVNSLLNIIWEPTTKVGFGIKD
jgi:hypothetical protein